MKRPLRSVLDQVLGRSGPSCLSSLLRFLGLCGLVALVVTRPAHAQAADCPPPVTAPSAEQMTTALQQARDRGLLWRIERDGRRSYLYGTIHVARLAWAYPGPQLRRALGEVGTLALELDVSDPGLPAQLRELTRRDDAPLPPALAERLAREVARACAPPGLLAALPPLMQAASLATLAGRRDGLEPAYGIDAVLSGFGHAAGKRVVALETLASQIAALQGEGAEDRARFIEQTLDMLASGEARPMVRRLAESWAAGDLAGLERYPQWCRCMDSEADRLLMRRLLDERNLVMAQRIEALHRDGGVLAAVGTLHLIGPQGLPALMAKQGFRVERVRFAP